MANKIELDAGQESALGMWCQLRIDELDTVLQPWRDKWNTMLKAYKLIRDVEVKTFPWEKASNVKTPDTLRAVVTVASQLYTAVWGAQVPFMVLTFKNGSRKVAKSLEVFLDFYTKVVQGQEDYWRNELPLWALYGTCITKLSYDDNIAPWPVIKMDSVPLNNFYIYPREKDISRASFVGESMYVHVKDLPDDLPEEKKKILYSYAYSTGRSDELLPSSEKSSAPEVAPGFIVLYDLYLVYDFSQKGEDYKEIRVVFHKDSSTVLFVEEVDGESRPYVPTFYRPDQDCFFGLGIGDAVLYLQEGIDTSVNQTLDNNTVANAKGFIRAREAGIDDQLEIYPGFVWTARDPKAIQAVSLGDINPGAFRSISLMRELLMSGAMIGENASGLDSTITRSRQTYGGQALNVAISSRLQNFNSAGYYRGLEELAWRTLAMLKKYSPDLDWVPFISAYVEDMAMQSNPLINWTDMDMEQVSKAAMADLEALSQEQEQLQETPGKPEPGASPGTLSYALETRLTKEAAELLRNNVFLSDVVTNRRLYAINASKKNENKQVERQSTMILSQIVQQYTKQVIEFAMQIAQLQQQPGTEMLVKTLTEAWRSANVMMRQVLSTYTVGEIEDLIIDLEEVQNVLGGGMGAPAPGGAVPEAGGGQEGGGGPAPPESGGPIGPGSLGGNLGVQGRTGISPNALQAGQGMMAPGVEG